LQDITVKQEEEIKEKEEEMGQIQEGIEVITHFNNTKE